MDGAMDWLSPLRTGAEGAHDKTIINRIMLKFRPIAPKPVDEGSVSGTNPGVKKFEAGTKRKSRRKYVRIKRNNKKCSSKLIDGKERKKMEVEGEIVNLGLQSQIATGSMKTLDFSVQRKPMLMNFNNPENSSKYAAVSLPDQSDRTSVAPPGRVVESWVTIDKMTNMWVDGGGLGGSDMEKMKSLEVDTCPSLISDSFDKVRWVNLAYRRMVDPLDEEEPAAEITVWLVVKDKIAVHWPAFACTVRVVYRQPRGKEKHFETMPCDVWKMDFGGFAWRLDSKAALRLGR
ncbi:uncharacterized protein LOC111404256 [Olea europaea var. sylvestris]|uniref:uncharacterized protein LOC111404256 n=1 Tax=Olea europaea var. sylvestris TaxID=158386 RepID=UPI000C1CFD6F|nr:uncharacterized protein LOC111404256 [Olea europaea var. sylvestris]